jgi:hypothetical protein
MSPFDLSLSPRFFNTSNTPGVTAGAVTISPLKHLHWSLIFIRVHVAQSLVLCSVCCFCPFSFSHCIVWSSLIYGFYGYPIGIFQLFLQWKHGTKWHIHSENKLNSQNSRGHHFKIHLILPWDTVKIVGIF